MPETGPRATPSFELTRPAIAAGLYILAVAAGATMIIGVILAYVWSADAAEWERGHFRYLIRTFWMSLAGFLLILLIVFATRSGLGFGLAGIAAVALSLWVFARSINSFVKAGASRPIPDPGTWLL